MASLMDTVCGQTTANQLFRILITSICLAVWGIQDLKRRAVSIRLCALAALSAAAAAAPDVAAALSKGDPGTAAGLFFSLLQALLPGSLLLCLAFAAGDCAGTGDGLCFLVLGVFLGARTVWILFTASLLLLSLCGIVLLLLKKAGRRTKMPFLTFTAAAWAGLLLTGARGGAALVLCIRGLWHRAML